MVIKMQQWKQIREIRKWRADLRKQVLERDRYSCQSCGYNPNSIVIGKKMKLHIHHIDKNRKNNVLSNLITLCASCHSKLHYRAREGV